MISNLSLSLHTNINDISIEDWTALEQDNLFSTKSFLQATANCNPHINHMWILAKESNSTLGVLYFQCIPFNGSELKSYKPGKIDGFLSGTKQALVDCVLDKINWRLAVLGNIFITGENGQYFHSSVNYSTRWEIIEKAAQKIFTDEKPDAVLITDVYENMLEGSKLLKDAKFRPFAVEPDMIFDVKSDWQDFTDYMSSISSKYRVRAKKVMKNSKEISSKEFSYEEVVQYNSELYKLYNNVMDKVDFKLTLASSDYFLQIKKQYPQDFVITGYFRGDELVGFISYFIQPHQMDVHLIGINYLINKDVSLYQRILYDCVGQGIKHQCEQIHFGRTASIIKTTIGAKPYPVQSFIKHINTISNIAFKPLTSYLKPEPFTSRNPFK